MRGRTPSGVGYRTRGAHGAAQELRQLFDDVPVLGTAQATATRDDHLGVLQLRAGRGLLADLLEDFDGPVWVGHGERLDLRLPRGWRLICFASARPQRDDPGRAVDGELRDGAAPADR